MIKYFIIVLFSLLTQCSSTENTSTSFALCGVCSSEPTSFLSHVSDARVTDSEGSAVAGVEAASISASQTVSLEEDGDCEARLSLATGYSAYQPVAQVVFSFSEGDTSYDVVIQARTDVAYASNSEFSATINGDNAVIDFETGDFSSASEFVSLSEDFASPSFYEMTLVIAYTNGEGADRTLEMDVEWAAARTALAYSPETTCTIDCVEHWEPDGESADVDCNYDCAGLQGEFSYGDFFGGGRYLPEEEIFGVAAVVEAAGACLYSDISADLDEIPNLDFNLE